MDKNTRDLMESVNFIKDNMATKIDIDATNVSLESFKVETANNFEIVNGKIDGIRRWTDIEVEERKKLEDRISKMEEAVHP